MSHTKTRTQNSNYTRSEQYVEDRENIRCSLKELKISANRLSKLAGLSSTALSLCLNGKYTSCPRPVFEKALSALDKMRSKRAYSGAMPFVETSVVRQINATCNETYASRNTDSIGLITGHVGVGKSTAIKRYCDNNDFAVLIRASIGMSKSAMLRTLSHEINMSSSRYGTIAQLQADIVRFLKDNPVLIILDEAFKATGQALEALRDISDESESGLVYVGREMLYDRLASNSGEFAEIASRILTWNRPIKCLSQDDIYLIIEKSLLTRDLDDDTKEMVFQCSQNNPRLLQHLMQKLYNWRSNNKYHDRDDTLTADIVSQIYHSVVYPESAAWRKKST